MRKKFSIDAAKSGAKIITRNGRPARIVDFSIRRGSFKIVAVIPNNDTREDGVYLFTEEGKFYSDGQQSDNDLFIEVEPTIRPYANAAEMDAGIIKHGCIVMAKNSKDRRSIKSYHEGFVALGGLKAIQTYKCLFKMYTWLDGSPCGILEGGEDE